VHFTDMSMKDKSALVSYVSINGENWIPVLLEISQKSIQIHVYKNQTRTVGLAYVQNASSVMHTPKLLVANDTGAVSVFPTPCGSQLNDAGEETIAQNAGQSLDFTVDDLP